MPRLLLPIDAVLPELVVALQRAACAVLHAPTGAGKTTRVPPALLDAGLVGDKQIILLEPRRLAARAAARRMAHERGGQVGDEIGYHVRFDRCAGARTRILVVTPGILLRLLQDDPFLESAGAVICDEFHERGLESDLALGMVRLIQQTVRPEFRLVVMSATLAVDAVAAYLGGCPIVAGTGRLFPVDIRYQPRPERLAWPVAVARTIEDLLDRTNGDVLVFLPGVHEIRRTARQLGPLAQQRDLTVVPLYGDLPAEQQDAALLPLDRRKVVLATNVAETSVTVEGITGVADTGLARVLQFDPALGLDRLRVVPISRASAEQRAGRAGRTQPGVCVRLWGESAHLARPEQTEAEIRRVDLAPAVLQLLAWGEPDLAGFPWFEQPREASVAQALALIRRLGACTEEGITARGRRLARLPVHPRIGCLLLEGERLGCRERSALAAALLSERDPFLHDEAGGMGKTRPRPATPSDVLERVEAIEGFEREGRAGTAPGPINRSAARAVLRVRDQLLRVLHREARSDTASRAPDEEGLLRALLAAFPDRVACRREPGSPRGVMVGGRGVRLGPTSGVTEAELFLCVDVDASEVEALVRQASWVRREWLPADQLTTSIEVTFDTQAERVTANRRVRYEDLVLEEHPVALPGGDQPAEVLLAAAQRSPERVLSSADSPAGRYVTRIRCLREWMPELGLPDFDQRMLLDLLPELCRGCRSFAELRHANWLSAIRARLTSVQWQAVEREAPERLTVPSGSRIALHYELGRPPVLAVRIQEVFGLRDTPRIAAGRVRVLLHLLAPNHRPQQVTDDLASFWANTYPLIRKELRARYPKHAWPDNPATATPERRP